MENKKALRTHYLSISYKVLINNRIIHFILFLLEMYIIIIHIMEIYCFGFKSNKSEDIKTISILAALLREINKASNYIKCIIYIIIIIGLTINNYILNLYRVKNKCFTKIMVNASELLFNRLLSIYIFDFLFLFKDIYFYCNILLTMPFIFTLVSNFLNNNLFYFFPSIVTYPYDKFSMIIDLHLLIMKLFLSLSGNNSSEMTSKFFFILSIIILFVLLFYITYIIMQKSYYLMNNCYLNKFRYSMILASCLNIIFLIIVDKEVINNLFYVLIIINIIFLCILIMFYFYDPYKFCKFDKDDNIENVYYYFFILDRDKNKYLLLEEKIEDHIFNCYNCDLCKKYKNIKTIKKIDLYSIIYNCHNSLYNLLNKLIKGINKNGKDSFADNSYYLINIIYIYHFAINHKDYNSLLNIELLFDIINSENAQFLEENIISLNQIKYTNKFFIKANNIITGIYKIFDEEIIEKKIKHFFSLAELLNNFKYKEIKNNLNCNERINNDILQNCNNLLSVSSLFYEELYNESITNSGNFIRDSPNIIEDLINNNHKSSKQITLEINVKNNKVKIIRAGGYMNKYENYNLFDIIPSFFRGNQNVEMKKKILYSNEILMKKLDINKNIKKKKINEKQYINLNFIIEEKEDEHKFCRLLKSKLSLILLENINTIFYLNGV